ncbi:LacI family DNA-binding transcriptional regulator [Roseomonas elaeocarpi]|uniref:LacI family DNA-binding transcriptional regulator n=1 Tax=Roseomonas elaeocarpi TaxID=907779 RepID=A0ABV6JSL2_9PROT
MAARPPAGQPATTEGATGRTTSLHVARRAGVSQTTVSLVLNGGGGKAGLSPATQEKVRQAAAELGYTPNNAARNLRRQRTGNLTFLCPDLGNPYFAEVIGAAQAAAAEGGYLLDIIAAQDEAAKLQAIARLRGGISDGVITTAPTTAIWDALRDLSARGIACVTLQDRGDDPAIPAVGVDLEAGGHAATRHLLALGHRRIAHVSGRQSFPLRARERVHGYRRALEEAGLAPDAASIVEVPNSMAGGAEAVAQLLARGTPLPEALFVFNDNMAIGALHALHRAGLRVPGDIAVVGFDGVSLGAFSTPMLTTVEHPRAELGRLAAESVMARLNDPARPAPGALLPGRLVVRESCGARGAAETGKGGARAA